MAATLPDAVVAPPRFVAVEAHRNAKELARVLQEAALSFPIIAKPVAACGEAQRAC
jgi:hypothetical protein